MEDVNKSPKENNPFLFNGGFDEEKKAQILALLDKFVTQYIYPTSDEDRMESSDDDSTDGVFNYALNLLKSFIIFLDCKDAVASGNGERLALIQKQMLFYFSSISGFNLYAIEMCMMLNRRCTSRQLMFLFPLGARLFRAKTINALLT
jgi:hypothetical protein